MMNLEETIKMQMTEVENLEKCVKTINGVDHETILKLREENEKLKYQLKHLQRASKTTENENKKFSINILKVLTALFDYAIRQTYSDIEDFEINLTPCTNAKFGDYQCNNAMEFCKIFKKIGVNKSPKDIAEEIVSNLIDNDIIAKLDIAPSGFINIFIKREFVSEEIKKIIFHGVLPPKYEKQRILIDYSSPNIAKEMHVGHLRSTIIGDCLARLFRFIGCDVKGINHIGDWGTQFGMLIRHLMDKFPNFREAKSVPIADLQMFYKESKKRFDDDEEFKKRAYESVVKLQSRDEEHIEGWKLICDISRREFNKIYERLNITDLVECGESFYHNKMVKLIENLDKQGFLELDEGRKLLRSKESEFHMLMVKSDGGFTYDTSDMAALEYRIKNEQADTILYVVDNGQGNHFDGLFNCARRVGLYDPTRHRLEFVGFGVVLGEDGKKFKSRSSETVRLVDLLDEGLQRAETKLKEKERDKELTKEELKKAQLAVAYGCIKYADLSHNRTKEYTFSFDKMLEDKGNTAVYLLYTYTRISGISRNAGVTHNDIISYINSTHLIFEHEKEWKLAKFICKFSDKIHSMITDLTPHTLCEYLYNLCCCFTEFYEVCYCIERTPSGDTKCINMWRIVLCEATAAVLRQGFEILGIKYVERM